MPLATSRIAVTVVAGGRGSGKSHLIDQLRAACPPRQRWALLSNSGATAGGEAVSTGQYFHVAGGCACCVAGPALRTTLVRLLRAGPWDHLHIEVDAAGHPHTLVDQLRTPPFDQYLTVRQLLLTLREDESALYQASPDALAASARIGFATDFLLRSGPGADQVSPDSMSPHSAPPLAGWLEAAPPWPRPERVAGRSLAQADSGLQPDLPGWRVFSASPPAQAAENLDLARQWPATMVAQRRPLKALLSALATGYGVTGFQALMRTPRAWYCWSFGRGRGAGPLAFNYASQIIEAETSWRFDNRICLWLEPGARRQAIEAHLQGLDLALQGPDAVPDPSTAS